MSDISGTSAAERLAATSNSLLLKAQSCALVCSSHIAQLTAQSLYCTKSWRPQLRDQTLCFSAYDRLFSAVIYNEGLGMMQTQCRAGGVCCRSQEPLSFWWGVEVLISMDSRDKHVDQISFRQCITFCEHLELKGRQPHFQLTVAKSSISTIVRWFATVT